MIFLLSAIATKLGYLLNLCRTDFGASSQDHIIACLANLLTGATSVKQLAEHGAGPEQIVSAAVGISGNGNRHGAARPSAVMPMPLSSDLRSSAITSFETRGWRT